MSRAFRSGPDTAASAATDGRNAPYGTICAQAVAGCVQAMAGTSAEIFGARHVQAARGHAKASSRWRMVSAGFATIFEFGWAVWFLWLGLTMTSD